VVSDLWCRIWVSDRQIQEIQHGRRRAALNTPAAVADLLILPTERVPAVTRV